MLIAGFDVVRDVLQKIQVFWNVRLYIWLIVLNLLEIHSIFMFRAW